jgi:hypothetical protein
VVARVTASPVSGWRDAFVAAGEAALATKPVTAEELEADRLKKCIRLDQI